MNLASLANRYESDAWQEIVAAWIETKGLDKVSIGQVARDALDIETPRIGTADQRRIAAVLERLGWRRLPKDWNGVVRWCRGDG